VAARTAATPPSDRRSVARARVRRGRIGARRLGGLLGLGARALLGKGRLGRRASGGARAHDVAARWRSARFQFAGAVFELIFLQIFA
jgi:hypothetical protein